MFTGWIFFHVKEFADFHVCDIFSRAKFFPPNRTSQFEIRTGDNLKPRSCPWWKNCDGALLDFRTSFFSIFSQGPGFLRIEADIFFSRLGFCFSRVGFCWNFSREQIIFHGLFQRFFHGKDQVFTGWKLIFFTGYKNFFTGKKKTLAGWHDILSLVPGSSRCR